VTSERWNSNNYSSNEESDRCQSIAGSGHGIVRTHDIPQPENGVLGVHQPCFPAVGGQYKPTQELNRCTMVHLSAIQLVGRTRVSKTLMFASFGDLSYNFCVPRIAKRC
jgi:hypothetical protein